MNTNAANVWQLLNAYAHNRREGHSHADAVQAVRGLAINACSSAEITAAIELGAALEWWGAKRLQSDSDLVGKWRAAGSPV